MIDLNGEWDVRIEFIFGEARHRLKLEQNGEQLAGVYHSQYSQQPLQGIVKDNGVRIETQIHHQAQGLRYLFEGEICEDEIQGTLDVGEYWRAAWRAKKH